MAGARPENEVEEVAVLEGRWRQIATVSSTSAADEILYSVEYYKYKKCKYLTLVGVIALKSTQTSRPVH